MPNTFFASDHHFGHANIIKFLGPDGVNPLRDFNSTDEMNEHMIERHNSVVRERDTCWFLGDVVINRRYLKSIIPRLNGRLRLVLGNHDIFKNKDYYEAGFEDLHAFRKFDGFVCTHVPVHSDSLRASWNKNVHGHTHANRVMFDTIERADPRTIEHEFYTLRTNIDPRYYAVCMEQLDDYTPISLEDLRNELAR